MKFAMDASCCCSSSSSVWSSSSSPSASFAPAAAAAAAAAQSLVLFKSRRSVNVSFRRGPHPPEEYVQQVERVVKVTFPDSARIRFLGDSTWRATLKPVTFFHLSATPKCDMRVYYENKALKLSSNKLMLDFSGFPDEFKNLDFDFSLSGQLGVGENDASTSQLKRFLGFVDMGLSVDMPLPFSLMPQSILTPVGDGILDRILGAMEAALLDGLIRDYREWCKIRSAQMSSDVELIIG